MNETKKLHQQIHKLKFTLNFEESRKNNNNKK